MVGKRACVCQAKKATVQALVQETKKGKGKNVEVSYKVLSCDNSRTCEKSLFCRFVNPLTTRVPLEVAAAEEPAQASAQVQG